MIPRNFAPSCANVDGDLPENLLLGSPATILSEVFAKMVAVSHIPLVLDLRGSDQALGAVSTCNLRQQRWCLGFRLSHLPSMP